MRGARGEDVFGVRSTFRPVAPSEQVDVVGIPDCHGVGADWLKVRIESAK